METINENKEAIIEPPVELDIENIGIEMGRVESDIESNDSFPNIKSNYTISTQPKPKMRTCGTWGEGCLYCCCMPLLCIVNSCRLCFSCCGPLLIQTKQLYFFILYLFTGELNSEAVEYKNYFNIKSTKDDQINVPEILITTSSIVFELYKTMIGSFLTVFTAQRCGQQTCTIWENIVPKNDLELAGIVFNFLMATTLLIEYIFEIMREAYLIKYLKYDKSLANNGEHIAELYENTDKSIFAKLIPLYIIYIRFSYVVLLIYFVNVVLSAVIVAENYYDNTSIFSFVTNALFIIYKIYNVVEITSYRGDYFYSAYKKKNIHYNDIKPKYLLKTYVGDDAEEHPIVNVPSEPENVVVEPVLPQVVDIEQSVVEPKPEAITIDLDSIFNGKFAPPVENYTPQKTVDQVIKEVEHLDYDEQREILNDLFEKNYIDKRDYRKISLILRKTDIGGLRLHKG